MSRHVRPNCIAFLGPILRRMGFAKSSAEQVYAVYKEKPPMDPTLLPSSAVEKATTASTVACTTAYRRQNTTKL
jgi:hypothetical protein